MDKIISNIVNNKDLKQKSIQEYSKKIKVIFNKLFDGNYDIKNLYKFRKVKQFLSNINPHTAKLYVVVIINILKTNNKRIRKDVLARYEKLFNSLKSKINSNYDTQEKSKKELENWIEYPEIISKRDNLYNTIQNTNVSAKNYKDLYQQYVILCLYTYIPPIRNNFVKTKFSKWSGGNYFDLDNHIFHLNNYKTDKIYGQKQIELPPKLVQILKKWKTICNCEWVLMNFRTNTPMESTNFSKFVNKIFYPRKISSTIIRKSYLSYKYPVNHTINDMKKDANIMGHSIAIQQTIYRKK